MSEWSSLWDAACVFVHACCRPGSQVTTTGENMARMENAAALAALEWPWGQGSVTPWGVYVWVFWDRPTHGGCYWSYKCHWRTMHIPDGQSSTDMDVCFALWYFFLHCNLQDRWWTQLCGTFQVIQNLQHSGMGEACCMLLTQNLYCEYVAACSNWDMSCNKYRNSITHTVYRTEHFETNLAWNINCTKVKVIFVPFIVLFIHFQSLHKLPLFHKLLFSNNLFSVNVHTNLFSICQITVWDHIRTVHWLRPQTP